MEIRPGVIYLVGAGPGDPGLITVRGLEVLQAADFVLHDRLVAPELLARARADAILENVGDTPGRLRRSQDATNARLIELARRGKVVCRLKGGDPFVFGRGGEELQAAAEAGVPCEIVPGVSAAFAAPAVLGIPLTHRAIAPAVTVVTGHEDPSKPEPLVDWAALAKLPGTIVIMMGVATLAACARALIDGGRSADEPVVVVEQATLPDQRVVRGTLATIARSAAREHIGSPAVIVIGPVVGLDQRARA
jgi:uroporphyrin-III C-methyltransferase